MNYYNELKKLARLLPDIYNDGGKVSHYKRMKKTFQNVMKTVFDKNEESLAEARKSALKKNLLYFHDVLVQYYVLAQAMVQNQKGYSKEGLDEETAKEIIEYSESKEFKFLFAFIHHENEHFTWKSIQEAISVLLQLKNNQITLEELGLE